MVKLCLYLNRAQCFLQLGYALCGLSEEIGLLRGFSQDCIVDSYIKLDKLYVLGYSHVNVF